MSFLFTRRGFKAIDCSLRTQNVTNGGQGDASDGEADVNVEEKTLKELCGVQTLSPETRRLLSRRKRLDDYILKTKCGK